MTTPFDVRLLPGLPRPPASQSTGTALATSNPDMVDTATASPLALRPSLPATAENVLLALRGAADQTGADFDYLLNTAMRESSLNPDAKAATSSATGLFQFVEQTWLGTMQRHGADHGLGDYANAIKVGKDGHYTVADRGLRQEILALRKDPKIASLMAGELTNDMRGDMETALGRNVSPGELYVAHFLGPQAAVKMIKTAETNPAASAASLFADAAASNSNIFYSKGGQARSIANVLESLKAKHLATPSPVFAAIPSSDGIEPELPAQPLRGPVQDGRTIVPPSPENASTRFGMNTMVMSPVLAQILSAQDQMASLADVFAPDDEPDLRSNSL